jgi:hypothetical protein
MTDSLLEENLSLESLVGQVADPWWLIPFRRIGLSSALAGIRC